MREWIYGRNAVYETLQSKRRNIFRLRIAAGVSEKGRLAEIIKIASERKLVVERVQRPVLDSLAEGHQGVAMEVSGYAYSDLAEIMAESKRRGEPLFVLALDLIQNPQNLGTLLRTAEAVGVHGVIMPGHRAAGITPAVVNASSGACEHLLVAQVNIAQALDELKAAGGWVIGLEGSPIAKLPEQVRLDGPLVLVVGNEGEGMRDLVRKKCDFLLALPMLGTVESLNAAVAGSVVLYLALAARKKTETPQEQSIK